MLSMFPFFGILHYCPRVTGALKTNAATQQWPCHANNKRMKFNVIFLTPTIQFRDFP